LIKEIYGCDELVGYLSLLFTALLIHGSVPAELATSIAIPIHKGRRLNLTDSENYRGISLSCIFGKVYDLIVLLRFSDTLAASSVQCGSKAKRSTSILAPGFSKRLLHTNRLMVVLYIGVCLMQPKHLTG